MSEPASPKTRPAPLVVWVLLLLNLALLSIGNYLVPVVAGVDFTPFELAGPPFFLVVLPASALLVRFRHSAAALAIVVLHAAALAAFIGRFLGSAPAVLVVAAYTVGGILAAYIAKHKTASTSPSTSGHSRLA